MPKLFRAVIWVLVASPPLAPSPTLPSRAARRSTRPGSSPPPSAPTPSPTASTASSSRRRSSRSTRARATPAERLDDGRDFVPTNKWVVFGHHFAAIAGPGPLVGPTLAAQFGFLPGTLWIIVGVVLGGAVQDFVDPRVVDSARRQIARPDGEGGDRTGRRRCTALVAVLGIMIILLAVLALVVVNALEHSPWGMVTIGLTIPIALLMGVYLRWIRPGRVLEATAIGVVLLVVALFGGRWVAEQPGAGADVHAQRHDARAARSWSTASPRRCCRCGCCSRRATTSRRS